MDLEYLLYDPRATLADARTAFREELKTGEFFSEEHYLIQAIKKYLLDEPTKETLGLLGLDISDLLNGRYKPAQQQQVDKVYHDWNSTLGFTYFRQ